METKRDFEIGDLVWAKMKYDPIWPAQIVKPPADSKSTTKRVRHYVFFFGSNNFAWVPIDSIKLHTDEILQSVSTKKKSQIYTKAIERITAESRLALRKGTYPIIKIEPPEVSAINENNARFPDQPTSKEKKSNYKKMIEKISEESRLAPRHVKSPTIKKETESCKDLNTTIPKRRLDDQENKKGSFEKKVKSLAMKKESKDVSTNSVARTGNSKKSLPKMRPDDKKVKSCNKKGFKKSAEESASRIGKKNTNVKKVQSSKKTNPKRGLNSKNEKIPQKSASTDYSKLFSNTPPNSTYQCVTVGRLIDDAHGQAADGPSKREFFELLDLKTKSKSILYKSIRATEKKIGFIGLGMMGQRLVRNLIHSSHSVTVWNRSPEKCEDFKRDGAEVAQTPGDLVEKCDIIFCCVSGPDASKSLVFGNCGILSGLEKCTTPGSKGYVEMTTIDPVTSQEIAEAIMQKGGRYLEASISGSREMAENGALLTLTAGELELFHSCESCFSAISKQSFYLSCEVGTGSKMNLILSMFKSTSQAALAEAMALVERCGLQQTNFLELIQLEPFSSASLLEKGQDILLRKFTTNSSFKNQQKELNLALSLGNQHEQPLLLSAVAKEVFKCFSYSNHDVSAVYMGAKH